MNAQNVKLSEATLLLLFPYVFNFIEYRYGAQEGRLSYMEEVIHTNHSNDIEENVNPKYPKISPQVAILRADMCQIIITNFVNTVCTI